MSLLFLSLLAGSLVAHRLLRGRWGSLPPLKHPWLFLSAFAWEALMALASLSGLMPGRLAGPAGQAGAYALLLLGFWHNRHLSPMRLAALGALLNALVIAANGGHMPVDPDALVRAGLEKYRDFLEKAGDGLHALADENTRLSFLADCIPLAGRVVSLGDLLLALALAWLPWCPPSSSPEIQKKEEAL